MFKEQIKENSFSSKRQHDMFTTRWVSARTMKSTLRNAKHCVQFLWRCPKLNIEIPSTWMSRQLVLTHAWIIKNWNGIISKTRDKGLLLDYCTSGAELPFYAIASSDSSRFNRELPHLRIIYCIQYWSQNNSTGARVMVLKRKHQLHLWNVQEQWMAQDF